MNSLSFRTMTLRAAGVSRQKAGYMRSLADHFDEGLLDNRRMRRASDDAVIAEVTQVKGIGRWTADMLLLFCLGRPDVLPVGDLGVQNSMRLAYGLDAMPTPARDGGDRGCRGALTVAPAPGISGGGATS